MQRRPPHSVSNANALTIGQRSTTAIILLPGPGGNAQNWKFFTVQPYAYIRLKRTPHLRLRRLRRVVFKRIADPPLDKKDTAAQELWTLHQEPSQPPGIQANRCTNWNDEPSSSKPGTSSVQSSNSTPMKASTTNSPASPSQSAKMMTPTPSPRPAQRARICAPTQRPPASASPPSRTSHPPSTSTSPA